MRVTFANPCPSGTIEFSFSKSKLKFDVKKGDSIFSPSDGMVTKYKDQVLTISHDIHGDNWDSILMNIRPIVGPGQKVKKNDLIGYASDDRFSYEVGLGGGEKLNKVEDLITKGINSNDVKVTKSNDSDEEGEDDMENNNKGGKNKSDKYEPNMSDENLAGKGIMKMLLSPISFMQSALNLKESELKEKSRLIGEDIDRMKKLF